MAGSKSFRCPQCTLYVGWRQPLIKRCEKIDHRFENSQPLCFYNDWKYCVYDTPLLSYACAFRVDLCTISFHLCIQFVITWFNDLPLLLKLSDIIIVGKIVQSNLLSGVSKTQTSKTQTADCRPRKRRPQKRRPRKRRLQVRLWQL